MCIRLMLHFLFSTMQTPIELAKYCNSHMKLSDSAHFDISISTCRIQQESYSLKRQTIDYSLQSSEITSYVNISEESLQQSSFFVVFVNGSLFHLRLSSSIRNKKCKKCYNITPTSGVFFSVFW